jgi:hypothetical protein
LGKKLNYNDVKKYIEIESNSGYKLLSNEYKGSSKQLLFLCNHNHEYKTTFSTFKRGYRCPVCSGNIKKTHEQFCKEVYDLTKNEYEVISEYINAKTKVLIKMDETFTPNPFQLIPLDLRKFKQFVDFSIIVSVFIYSYNYQFPIYQNKHLSI